MDWVAVFAVFAVFALFVFMLSLLFFCVLPFTSVNKGKGKVFPYSLPSVGPGADPGVQAVSPQMT